MAEGHGTNSPAGMRRTAQPENCDNLVTHRTDMHRRPVGRTGIAAATVIDEHYARWGKGYRGLAKSGGIVVKRHEGFRGKVGDLAVS